MKGPSPLPPPPSPCGRSIFLGFCWNLSRSPRSRVHHGAARGKRERESEEGEGLIARHRKSRVSGFLLSLHRWVPNLDALLRLQLQLDCNSSRNSIEIKVIYRCTFRAARVSMRARSPGFHSDQTPPSPVSDPLSRPRKRKRVAHRRLRSHSVNPRDFRQYSRMELRKSPERRFARHRLRVGGSI